MDLLSDRNSALDVLAGNRKALELLSSGAFASTALAGSAAGARGRYEAQHRHAGEIAASPSFTKAIQLNNEALAGITGIRGLADTMTANIKAFTEITASPASWRPRNST